MITEEGMGDKTRNEVFLDSSDKGYYTISATKPYSEKTAELIDQEIKALTMEATKRAEAVLKANKSTLDTLAQALLENETLEEDDLKPILKDLTLPEIAKLHPDQPAKHNLDKNQEAA